MNQDPKKLSEEFREFMDGAEVDPPLRVKLNIFKHVNRDLNPSFVNVFMRVLGIHAALSIVTLSICSQFGLQLFPLFDLMSTFMSYVGHTYCMTFCGALYIGSSALSLSLVLTPEQVRVVRKSSFLQFLILSFISLAIFLFFGAEILIFPALLWITGALIAGVLSVELGWLLRAQFRKRVVFGI
jgi:hypothetical protein